MRLVAAIIGTLALASGPWAAEAALISETGEVRVNVTTDGAQHNPAVAVTPDREFLVVWEDNRFDNEGIHVRARRLNQSLEPLSGEIQVDSPGDVWNRWPDVAALVGGRFVVVWKRGVTGGSILARILAEDGTPASDEIVVGTSTKLDRPSVAPAANGGFVVAWTRGAAQFPFTAEDNDVSLRAFGAAGEPIAATLVIESVDTLGTNGVDIRATGDGGFVLAWASSWDRRARAQLLDASLTPVGPQRDDVGGWDPRVVTMADGSSLIVSSGGDYLEAPYTAIRARGLSEATLGEPFVLAGRVVRSGLAHRNSGPELAAARIASGDVVVAWSDGSTDVPRDGSDSGVYAQVFGADGYPRSGTRLVNVTTKHGQTDPEVETVGASGIVVAWESDIDASTTGDSGEVYVRLFEVAPPICGDGTADGDVTAADALLALQTSTGSASCARCLCDVDDSGTTAASDALALLQAGIGLPATLACPECPAGAGMPLELSIDDACHGLHVHVPASALPAGVDPAHCNIDPYTRALPCAFRLAITSEGLNFDARSGDGSDNCVLSQRTLFSCRAEASIVEAMAAAAVVHCGCGCAPECASPRLCAATGNPPPCSTPELLKQESTANAPENPQTGELPAAVAGHSVTEVALATSSASTTSLFACGTCCFTPVIGEIELVDPVEVTELRVKLAGEVDPTCLSCDAPGSELVPRDDGTVEFCIFRQAGIEGPGVLASCFANDGSITPGAAEVLRARGPDFEPIEAPSVINDF